MTSPVIPVNFANTHYKDSKVVPFEMWLSDDSIGVTLMFIAQL